jgi:hypothetical protein
MGLVVRAQHLIAAADREHGHAVLDRVGTLQVNIVFRRFFRRLELAALDLESPVARGDPIDRKRRLLPFVGGGFGGRR